jgi:hypothetical protein
MGSRKKAARTAQKPTFASVTDVSCTCQFLERVADEPDVPIVFDTRMNEYHLTSLGKNRGYTMIYHCPFCGGAAPRSKRDSFFATITQSEEERLRSLTSGLATADAVIKKLGKPDSDMVDGLVVKTPGSRRDAPTIKGYRVLRYGGLSKTADVDFTDYGPERGVRATFHSKYLKTPSKKRT